VTQKKTFVITKAITRHSIDVRSEAMMCSRMFESYTSLSGFFKKTGK
jgi:hypothetical protein